MVQTIKMINDENVLFLYANDNRESGKRVYSYKCYAKCYAVCPNLCQGEEEEQPIRKRRAVRTKQGKTKEEMSRGEGEEEEECGGRRMEGDRAGMIAGTDGREWSEGAGVNNGRGEEWVYIIFLLDTVDQSSVSA